MRPIHQDNGGNLVRVTVCKPQDVKGSHGMANQDERRLLAGFSQECFEFLRYSAGHASRGTFVAPAVTRAIIRAHAGEASNLGLNLAPVEIGAIQAMFQNHRGTTLPGAVEMKTISAHINQSAGRWIQARIPSLARALINETANSKKYKKRNFGQ